MLRIFTENNNINCKILIHRTSLRMVLSKEIIYHCLKNSIQPLSDHRPPTTICILLPYFNYIDTTYNTIADNNIITL